MAKGKFPSLDAFEKMLDRIPTDGAKKLISKAEERGVTVEPYHRNTVTPLDPCNGITVGVTEGITVLPSVPSHRYTVTPSVIPTVTPVVWDISHKQAMVLETLIQNPSRFTSYNTIGKAIGISRQGVYRIMQALQTKGIAGIISIERNVTNQGFKYWLNDLVCNHFIEIGGASQERYTNRYTYSDTVVRSNGDTVEPYHPSSSSSLLESKSTTKTIDEIMSDIEMRWWIEHGVDRSQVELWMREFDMTPDEILMSLSHGRFDLEHKPEIKKQKDYFYVTAKKSHGLYPRPKGYKSIKQQRAEAVEKQRRLDDDAEAKIPDGLLALKEIISERKGA